MQDRESNDRQLVDVEYGHLMKLPIYLWWIFITLWIIGYTAEGNY